jgi:hypothetical protein
MILNQELFWNPKKQQRQQFPSINININRFKIYLFGRSTYNEIVKSVRQQNILECYKIGIPKELPINRITYRMGKGRSNETKVARWKDFKVFFQDTGRGIHRTKPRNTLRLLRHHNKGETRDILTCHCCGRCKR